MMHPWYLKLVQEVYGKDSISNSISGSNSLTKFFEESISDTFYHVDNLNAEITKLKLSNLIDTNYNLLQELRKQDASKTN